MNTHRLIFRRRLRADRTGGASALAGIALAVALLGAPSANANGLDLASATIADLEAAFTSGSLTSEKLVSLYLARIEAYDKQGPMINAVITLNPKALDVARNLDAERKAGKIRGPLHGIPVVLKDNFDTFDLPTTAGCSLLKGSLPPDDAFVVKKLRDAGAIILAKVNLSEFASGGGAPNGFSSMGAQTRNPHDPMRGPAGSSGGTGAAIAAVFAQFGLGTDTGGSVRGPCAANGIAGLRPTLGLMSRDGIVPLALTFDSGGPMARSVHDVAVALGVMTGVDSADPATAATAGKFQTNYTQYLKTGSLRGARIGIARDFFGQHAGTDAVMEASIARLKALGAVVVDPVYVPTWALEARSSVQSSIRQREFGPQIADYLATLKPGYPRSLPELIVRAEDPISGYTNPWRLDLMRRELASGQLSDPEYLTARNEGRAMIRAALEALFAKHKLDAIVYPTSPRPARLIEGESESGGGHSATNFAPQTGFPDLIVPAGVTPEGLPVTISFFGLPFSEPKLFGYGYDFEQATKARRMPKFTPALPTDSL